MWTTGVNNQEYQMKQASLGACSCEQILVIESEHRGLKLRSRTETRYILYKNKATFQYEIVNR